MKKRYKYMFNFLVIHVLMTIFVFYISYPPSDPTLGVLFAPNIFIPLLVVDNLPDVFGYWSNLYWATIFWAIIGFLLGLVVEKIKAKKTQI